MNEGKGTHAAPIPQPPRAVPLQSLAKGGAAAILATLVGLGAWQVMTREPQTADPGPAIQAASEPFGEVVGKSVGPQLDAIFRQIGDLRHSFDRDHKSLREDVTENKRQIDLIRTYHDRTDQSWTDLDKWQRNMAAEIRALQQEVKLWAINKNR